MRRDVFKVMGDLLCAVGGWQCYCCGPRTTRDRKDKPIFRRRARHKLKHQDRVEPRDRLPR